MSEETRKGQTPAQEDGQDSPASLPLKLGVTARLIDPIKNLMGFATVTINDCFVVEDFKIMNSEKGLYVGMPSKPDKGSRTGYRDTVKPITSEFRKELCGAILNAYGQEIEKMQSRINAALHAPAPEKQSIKERLDAGKQVAMEVPRPTKEKPAKSAER